VEFIFASIAEQGMASAATIGQIICGEILPPTFSTKSSTHCNKQQNTTATKPNR
jgi:hypothetical protein